MHDHQAIAKPGSSMARVMSAADELGLDISVKIMTETTRTAEDAAKACGCEVARIVKSLIFADQTDDTLVLLLVSGTHNADLDYISERYGVTLNRADGRRVRDETGFAIGGVAPIGHLNQPRILIDETLMEHQTVWAAAGRPDAVFEIEAEKLQQLPGATLIQIRKNIP